MVNMYGLGPGAVNLVRPDKEVVQRAPAGTAHAGGYHVEPAVMLPYGGGEHSAGGAALPEGQLALPVQHMAQLLPVDKVPAMEEGHPGKKLEGAGYKIEIVSHPA